MRGRDRTIRVLRPRFEQHTYEDRALTLAPPHGPDCPCLACADARATTGHVPLESEFARRARLMRARDALLRTEESDPEVLPTLAAFALVAVLVVIFWAGALYLIERFVR